MIKQYNLNKSSKKRNKVITIKSYFIYQHVDLSKIKFELFKENLIFK